MHGDLGRLVDPKRAWKLYALPTYLFICIFSTWLFIYILL